MHSLYPLYTIANPPAPSFSAIFTSSGLTCHIGVSAIRKLLVDFERFKAPLGLIASVGFVFFFFLSFTGAPVVLFAVGVLLLQVSTAFFMAYL